MASDVLFEVDASQILAKLHLAGLQPLSGYDKKTEFIVNTGIKNDNQNAKPDNPGKVEFDLKNSSGEYEVGFVMNIKYTRGFNVDDKLNDIQQIISKNANKKLDAEIDDKEQKRLEELKKQIKTIVPDLKDDDIKSYEGIEKAIKTYKSNKKQDDDYAVKVNEGKEKAKEFLTTYMRVFAGTDNVKDISLDNIAAIEISQKVKDSNDSALVKMYEIIPITDAEKQKLIADFRATLKKNPNNTENNCTARICYKIKYDLNVDK